MSREQAEREIQNKAQALGASVVGDPAARSVGRWGDTSLYYLVYENGVILSDDGRTAVFVTNANLGAWLANGACDGLGFVQRDHEPIGAGRAQLFGNGTIYVRDSVPDRPIIVWNGLVADKYSEVGGAAGPLGFPISARRRQNLAEAPGIRVESQSFENGEIMAYSHDESGNTYCLAITGDGIALPRRTHRIEIEQIHCVEESNGLGSDEAGFTFVTTPMGEETDVRHWFHGDTDTGERFSINEVVYDGPLRGMTAVSLIGFEKDGPRAFKKSREHFERTMRELDDEFSSTAIDRSAWVLFGTGAVVGAVIGGALAPTTIGISAGAAAAGGGASVAGGAVNGGLIGAAVAVALIIAIVPPLRWRGTELLALDRAVYLGDLIASGAPFTEELTVLDNMPIPETPLRLSVSVEPLSPTSIRETRRYRNDDEDSTYEVMVRHDFS